MHRPVYRLNTGDLGLYTAGRANIGYIQAAARIPLIQGYRLNTAIYRIYRAWEYRGFRPIYGYTGPYRLNTGYSRARA